MTFVRRAVFVCLLLPAIAFAQTADQEVVSVVDSPDPRSSDALIVTSEMSAWRVMEGKVLTTHQPVEPGRRWIEAGERARIANVRIASHVRANLIVVNPGDETITVDYTLARTGSDPVTNHLYASIGEAFVVAPRSMMIVSLPEGPAHDCMRLVPCANAMAHEVVLQSTGRFYAATSSIENDLDATFRSPFLP